MANRPSTKFTDAAQIPDYLKKHGRFCLWRYEENKGRWTKVPYQPKAPQYGAASTKPEHFTDLQAAMGARKGFDGVGLGIFGDLAAVDIDHCISDTGELSLLAQTVIQTMDSYTEISPSGKGVRIVFRAAGVHFDKDRYYINRQDARDPRQKWPQKQGLEVYIAGATSKYVTITGNAIHAVEVQERSAQIQRILDSYMKKDTKERAAIAPAPSVLDLSDHDLIEVAMRARNGAQFEQLYKDGNISGYPSQSEADQALMNLICFYAGGDLDRMKRIFKTSALYRPKEKPESYYTRTAQKAIKDCTTFYTPPKPKTEADTYTAAAQKTEAPQEKAPATTADAVDAFLQKACGHDFEPLPTGYKTIDAAIGGGFIRQTIVLLGAAPGAGKTIFAQQVFEKIAKDGKANILYYNLEMSVEQLLARSISRETQIAPLEILQGYRWKPEQAERIRQAAQRYKKDIAPRIKYNACGSADYAEILQSMEREADTLQQSGDTLPLVVVIDYLQLLTGGNMDAVEVIKAAVKRLKDFAIRRNAIVFMIMAHSRATNESGIVTQGAGRDTSAIEYSADLQLSLTYKAMQNRVKNKQGTSVPEFASLSSLFAKVGALREEGNDAEADQLVKWRNLTVTKNRFGVEHATTTLAFEGEYSRFIEQAPKNYAAMFDRTKRAGVETI